MSGATVTIPLLEFQDLQNKIKIANDESASLARQLDDARQASRSEDETRLRELIQRAIPGIQHAIANLGPEISGWPVDAVRAWAGLVDAMTGANDGQTKELAIDLGAFARECENAQRLRNSQGGGKI